MDSDRETFSNDIEALKAALVAEAARAVRAHPSHDLVMTRPINGPKLPKRLRSSPPPCRLAML
jgi:hypothetical protein